MPNLEYRIGSEWIDLLFPLHVRVDGQGRIVNLGRTALSVLGAKAKGDKFLELFQIVKPRRLKDLDALRSVVGRKLIIETIASDSVPVQFRAVATPLGDEDESLLVDMAFGVSLADVIDRFSLSGADFKPNDFSIDLFYTFETQRTLLEDSQKLMDALQSAKDKAERKAYLDSMTGIANRRALHERLDEILEAPPSIELHALFHVDLDKFKSVNDTFGHNAGDEILKHTANVLAATAGRDGLAVRIGGDEFVLFLPGGDDPDTLRAIGDEMIQQISRPIRVGSNLCRVGASVGIVQFRAGEVPNSDRLLQNSDIALYESKISGNTATVLTAEMAARHEEEARLVVEISDALTLSEFEPYFQPQLDAVSGEVVGLEVVARWQKPNGIIRLPASFLNTAVRANLMGDIDKQVRRKAMARFAQWRSKGFSVGRLSLNVSASNLRAPDFIEDVQDELFTQGLCPQDIQLELLESILFDQSDPFLTARCKALKSVGFSLALDDFGTGHASISTLIDAPISTLKIDRSFVTGLDGTNRKRRITLALLAMAKEIGLDVLAEGVETAAELDILMSGGCRLFQGFYFGAPMPFDALETWLVAWAQGRTVA